MKLDYNTENLKDLKSSELKRIADYWLRQYLLKKAKRKGLSNYIYCPLKNSWFPEHRMHVAHFRDRHHIETRYSEENCHLISEQSNLWDSKIPKEGYKSKHHYEYEIYLRTKLGDKKVEKLLDTKEDLSIFTNNFYIGYINKFKNE